MHFKGSSRHWGMPGFSWCSCKVCQLKASSYFLLSAHSSQKYINFQVLSEAHVSQLENLLWGAKPAPVPASQLPLAAWGLLPVCCSLGSQESSPCSVAGLWHRDSGGICHMQVGKSFSISKIRGCCLGCALSGALSGAIRLKSPCLNDNYLERFNKTEINWEIASVCPWMDPRCLRDENELQFVAWCTSVCGCFVPGMFHFLGRINRSIGKCWGVFLDLTWNRKLTSSVSLIHWGFF